MSHPVLAAWFAAGLTVSCDHLYHAAQGLLLYRHRVGGSTDRRSCRGPGKATRVHGLIFFYLQKFANVAAAGSSSWKGIQSSVTTTTRFLPSGVYPDSDAVAILTSIAEATVRPLPAVLEDFGRFLAPSLLKVARSVIEPSWRTLDVIENTEPIIHAMIRSTNPGASPPVLEAFRHGPDELHVVYSSARQMCPLARGLMQGIAAHYNESIAIEEPSCLLKGDPFCSFVIRLAATETLAPVSELRETTAFNPTTGTPATSTPTRDAGRVNGVPATIGTYRVLEPIGSGAMGRVFLAEDPVLGRRVAIKVMHPSRAGDASARARFLRESRATAAVEHPNVVTIYQVGEEAVPGASGGLPFLVMQFLRGETLAGYRVREGHVPLPEVLRIGRQVAEGLWAAHRCGLLHRDIKPENIFLEGPDREVKIIDFGLARDIAGDPSPERMTIEGAVVGTPAYMSPEGIGDGRIDARSDLFGLGIILYELLANRLPFVGTSLMATLASISRGQPTPLRNAAPAVPGDVAELVMRLIAHEPDDRPSDARSVAQALSTLEKTHAPG